jgi:hypothetical protein
MAPFFYDVLILDKVLKCKFPVNLIVEAFAKGKGVRCKDESEGTQRQFFHDKYGFSKRPI